MCNDRDRVSKIRQSTKVAVDYVCLHMFVFDTLKKRFIGLKSPGHVVVSQFVSFPFDSICERDISCFRWLVVKKMVVWVIFTEIRSGPQAWWVSFSCMPWVWCSVAQISLPVVFCPIYFAKFHHTLLTDRHNFILQLFSGTHSCDFDSNYVVFPSLYYLNGLCMLWEFILFAWCIWGRSLKEVFEDAMFYWEGMSYLCIG